VLAADFSFTFRRYANDGDGTGAGSAISSSILSSPVAAASSWRPLQLI
jgi:hypothetical protein